MERRSRGKASNQRDAKTPSTDRPPPAQAEFQNEQPQAEQALWRVKRDKSYLPSASVIAALQHSLGNKAVSRMVERLRSSRSTPRRATTDVVPAVPDLTAIQRHSIPESRSGVGNEDDEILAMRLVQRQPAFGRLALKERGTGPWGNGRHPEVQRKGGKAGAGAKVGKVPPPPALGKKGAVPTPEETAAKKSEAEFKSFVKGGPYIIPDYVPDTVDDFGKFDSIYDPASKLLKIDMRIKFTFPDLPMPKGSSISDLIAKAAVITTRALYVTNFIGQVQKGWSGKFKFRNVREPQSVWGKLNPIKVKVNVSPVQAKQHYTMKAWLKKGGGKKDIANVTSNTPGATNPNPSQLEMFKGDLDPSKQSFTGAGVTGPDEATRLKRNLPNIRFAPGSSSIDAKYLPDLQFVSDYLRRMNRPKFHLGVVGHANKTGKEPSNVTYSQARARAVASEMKGMGVTNHPLTASGVGSAGASPAGSWRKVDFTVRVDKGFKNVQDTTLHEFGHMLGLDDEYVRPGGDTRTNTTQKKWMRKMLGSSAYGKGKENRYADEVTKVDPLSSASVMESGNEVRSYHYVTMWQALYDTAAKAASQPTPPLTFKDWKVMD